MFKKKFFFFVLKIDTVINKENNIPKEILSYINRFCFFRIKKIKYFEPFTNKETMQTYLIWGTTNKNAQNKINKNAAIFILELYAHIKDPNLEISFKKKEIKVKNYSLTIYTVPKFYA